MRVPLLDAGCGNFSTALMLTPTARTAVSGIINYIRSTSYSPSVAAQQPNADEVFKEWPESLRLREHHGVAATQIGVAVFPRRSSARPAAQLKGEAG